MTTLVMKHRPPTTVLRKRGIQIKKPAVSPDKPNPQKNVSPEQIDGITKVTLYSVFILAGITLVLVFISLLI